MLASLGLVFASKALEGAPLVYGEATQAGLPVLVAEGSTLATQVLADQTGATFSRTDAESLASGLRRIRATRDQLSRRARNVYEKRYTPDVWIEQITEIYEAAISAHGTRN